MLDTSSLKEVEENLSKCSVETEEREEMEEQEDVKEAEVRKEREGKEEVESRRGDDEDDAGSIRKSDK